ncbi:hypothetical protein V6N11_008797 [Hibiscus sabdariffa]|uniref:Uncharacterized protein n=2 Tax=Hibiscus sabdariffa TaxID=183260 RepID=A0ABR2AP51_9ROSI
MITTSKQPPNHCFPPPIIDETLKDDLSCDDVEHIKEIETPNDIRTSKSKTSQPAMVSSKTATTKLGLSSPFDFLVYLKTKPQKLQNGLNRLWVTVATAGVGLMRHHHPKNSSQSPLSSFSLALPKSYLQMP